jgi:hypothetical protein
VTTFELELAICTVPVIPGISGWMPTGNPEAASSGPTAILGFEKSDWLKLAVRLSWDQKNPERSRLTFAVTLPKPPVSVAVTFVWPEAARAGQWKWWFQLVGCP